jgi:uncharacterized membrane protein
VALAVTGVGEEPGGTLTEEVLRLVDALGGIAGAGEVGASAGSGAAAECRVCPVCRFIAGIRQLRPEAFAHLVAAAEEFLAAALAFAASTSPAGAAPEGAGAAPEPGGDGLGQAGSRPASATPGAGGAPGTSAVRGAPVRSPARPREPIELD